MTIGHKELNTNRPTASHAASILTPTNSSDATGKKHPNPKKTPEKKQTYTKRTHFGIYTLPGQWRGSGMLLSYKD